MTRKKPNKIIDLLDMKKGDSQIRVSPLFKKLIDERRKSFLDMGFTRHQASDRFITHQLAKELKKKNKRIIQL